MDQKKLYRTIESLSSKKDITEEELLVEILNKIVDNKEINVIGGRIWKLLPEKESYILLFQIGNVQKIKSNFQLKLKDYTVFNEIAKDRTILSDETNNVLRRKGIFKYSASGIGSRVKIGKNTFYEYLIALNSEYINEDLRDTLNIVATVITSQIKQRRIHKSAKTLQEDIDKAKQLQRSILPEHEYSFSNYELFGLTIPAETLGGDFFDYLKIGDDEERLGIVLGDAASKGLVAAAEAFYISGAIRMAATFQIKISPFMKRINELINKIFSDDKFTTLFYGELSTDKTGLFLYANAGHNPPIFISAKSKKATFLLPTGPLLGPAPHARFDTENINFDINDVLVIYSDGITDTANQNFEFYGEKRLEKKLRKVMNHSPKEIAYALIDDILKFSTKDGKYNDDKSLVIIKRIK